MAIKVNIPYGQHTATVSGLYQWDYGQELEIESADLGTMIGEVHFACSSMSEAIVVSCSFVENVCTVTIPNECLEQSSTITAWIYEIAGTQGRTRKVITIPVTARTRPSSGHDIPTEFADQYTQLITNVNQAVDKLENGQITAKKAETATKADSATTAGNASTASYAVSAGKADNANVLKLTPESINVSEKLEYTITKTGLYLVLFQSTDNNNPVASSLILITDLEKNAWGTSALSFAPTGTSGGGWGYASARYKANETTAPARKHVLSVYHPGENDLGSGTLLSPIALYKLADI